MSVPPPAAPSPSSPTSSRQENLSRLRAIFGADDDPCASADARAELVELRAYFGEGFTQQEHEASVALLWSKTNALFGSDPASPVSNAVRLARIERIWIDFSALDRTVLQLYCTPLKSDVECLVGQAFGGYARIALDLVDDMNEREPFLRAYHAMLAAPGDRPSSRMLSLAECARGIVREAIGRFHAARIALRTSEAGPLGDEEASGSEA